MVLALLVASGAGCQMLNNAVSNLSIPTRPKMKYSPYYSQSFEEVWAAVKEISARDWKIEKVDNERGRLNSDWDVVMAPSLYSGTRRKLTVEMERPKKGGVRVGIMVSREENGNVNEPLNEPEAEWLMKGSDDGAEQILLWRLDSRLTQFQPSPELLKRLQWEEAQGAAERKTSTK